MRLPPLWAWAVLLSAFPQATRAEAPEALRRWQDGQRLMTDGDAPAAIRAFQESLRLDPSLARNHLSLAAAYLADGKDEEALPHLERYLQAQPDHLVVRSHYGELLLRMARHQDARRELERFVADVQDHELLARQHLVGAHSHLMEIAQAQEDPYTEHLHRGIGLYLLARQRAELGGDAGPLTVEGLLCKAAGELSLARARRPQEARPHWYLFEVWTLLAQAQPAGRCLRAAAAAAPLSYLTPSEHRCLQLACRAAERDARHK